MSRTLRLLAAGIAVLLLALPFLVSAAPFGGRASIVKYCYNQTIYALLGAPRGGPFVWYPATKTYQFGPPSHAGQWILGLSSGAYYCLWSVQPQDFRPATAIMMMGSSR